MKSNVYLIIGKVLSAITVSTSAVIIVTAIIHIGDWDGFMNAISLDAFNFCIVLLFVILLIFFQEPEPLSERELAGHASKSGVKRIYSEEEVEKLEAEAQYAIEAEEYYINPEKFEKCQ